MGAENSTQDRLSFFTIKEEIHSYQVFCAQDSFAGQEIRCQAVWRAVPATPFASIEKHGIVLVHCDNEILR